MAIMEVEYVGKRDSVEENEIDKNLSWIQFDQG